MVVDNRIRMMLNFPDQPTIGQKFHLYVWDGEKWTMTLPPQQAGDPASNLDPRMNVADIVAPGTLTLYSRDDHRHPTDDTLAPIEDAVLTGLSNITHASVGSSNVVGKIAAIAKGHTFGSASGNITVAVDKADTNIILYDDKVNAGNWAGFGSDASGRFFIRTGDSGSPAAAFWMDQQRQASFLQIPDAPTPPLDDNSLKLATTSYVLNTPAQAGGPYLPLSGGTVTGGIMYINGDLRTYWSNGTGCIYLNAYGDRYLYYDGGGYYMNGAHAYTANGRLWGNGDFNWPIINERLAYYGDYNAGTNTGLQEPWGGCIYTGMGGHAQTNGSGIIQRMRQWQVCTSSWWAVGYA
jgi:hypothetical protein